MNVKVIFGENLKLYRKSHNLTQEVLAEKLEITPTHLSRIENGKSFVTVELLDALCVIFGISPATLFLMPQEFKGDDSLFMEIDTMIDEELKKAGIDLKKRIRDNSGTEHQDIQNDSAYFTKHTENEQISAPRHSYPAI